MQGPTVNFVKLGDGTARQERAVLGQFCNLLHETGQTESAKGFAPISAGQESSGHERNHAADRSSEIGGEVSSSNLGGGRQCNQSTPRAAFPRSVGLSKRSGEKWIGSGRSGKAENLRGYIDGCA